MTPFYTPDPEIGLFGGRWVLDPVARVVRWVQEREPSPMTPDLCAVCDVAFQRTNNRQRYCSEPCYKEARRQQGRVNTASYRRRTEGDAA